MRNITNIGIWVLLTALPISVRAGQQSVEMNNGKSWEGTLTAVDTQDNTVQAKRWDLTETFHLGRNCAIAAIDKREAALSDLRPGERVSIHYQNAEGVRVADRIVEKALRYDGTVQAANPKGGTVTMAEAPLYKPFRGPEVFRLATNCPVILANGTDGTLADLGPGDRIAVTYELPNGSPVAYRIRAHTSTFVGKLDAIDLSARTVKAKLMAGEKSFDLADKCRIIAGNQKSERLKDLAVGQQYRFTYQEVNGVNVLDQIAPAPEAKPAETASAR